MDHYRDPQIGERVLFIDNDGEIHLAVVVDDCAGSPYVTLVWGGEQGELGHGYHSKVETETSVHIHEAFDSEGTATHSFVPVYWDDGWAQDESLES